MLTAFNLISKITAWLFCIHPTDIIFNTPDLANNAHTSSIDTASRQKLKLTTDLYPDSIRVSPVVLDNVLEETVVAHVGF